MEIINFQEAKARKYSKEKTEKHLSEVDDGVLKLQKQYREYAQYCNRWYYEHVVGQDENGRWIYKDL